MSKCHCVLADGEQCPGSGHRANARDWNVGRSVWNAQRQGLCIPRSCIIIIFNAILWRWIEKAAKAPILCSCVIFRTFLFALYYPLPYSSV